MTIKTSVIWRLVAPLTLILLMPLDSLACTCTGPRGKQALDGAAAAFSGKIARIEYLDANGPRVEPRIIVTFEVYRTWKGPLKKSAVLHTVYNKWTCSGYPFKEGEEYLVFAYRNAGDVARKFAFAEDSLGVNTCGMTGLLEKAQEELRELGPGRKPE